MILFFGLLFIIFVPVHYVWDDMMAEMEKTYRRRRRLEEI